MEIQNKKINFLGDSITEGVGASDLSHNYVNTFLRKYAPAAVRNYGIAGTRIARQQTPTAEHPEWDRDFCSRVSEMEADADIVVVFGGVNDHGHGDAPFGSFADRTPDTFCGACHTLMRALIERFPRATIVFMTPLHCTREDRPNKRPYRDYVDAIIETANYYAIPVLDLYRRSGIQPLVPILKQTYIPDGVHPNDTGAERIADRLAAFLQTL